jgi:hypothetical protein
LLLKILPPLILLLGNLFKISSVIHLLGRVHTNG